MHAAAFVVGSNEGAGASLAKMARDVGFALVEPYSGLGRAERQLAETPLVFFLCAAVVDIARLKPMADAVRFSDHFQLRFSPLIYFARDPSVEAARACIAMGFDDVIALPYRGGDLGARLGRQVGRRCTYCQSATYFGPDRRDRPGKKRPAGEGDGRHRQIEIIRNPLTGVELLGDDLQIVI